MSVTSRVISIAMQMDEDGNVRAMQLHQHVEVTDAESPEPETPFTKTVGQNCHVENMSEDNQDVVNAFIIHATDIMDSSQPVE